LFSRLDRFPALADREYLAIQLRIDNDGLGDREHFGLICASQNCRLKRFRFTPLTVPRRGIIWFPWWLLLLHFWKPYLSSASVHSDTFTIFDLLGNAAGSPICPYRADRSGHLFEI
jgi:hypothetical protein